MVGHRLAGGAGADLAGCARLETLILEDNALAAWAEVEAAFGALPRLERLQLSGNRVPSDMLERIEALLGRRLDW